MNQLNAQQLEAVHHLEGPMLVLAGPGSGKTTMITHRILHMIQETGIEERKIWVVTYTRAAAQEMRSRFLHLRGDGSDGNSLRNISQSFLEDAARPGRIAGSLDSGRGRAAGGCQTNPGSSGRFE